jgi:ATP-dependent RNA helicase DeaD
MLCNRGKITRSDIGAIRIFDTETKFEVSAEVAEQFAANAKRTAGEDGHITQVNGAPERGSSERAAPRQRPPQAVPRETPPVSKTERKKRSRE